MRLMNGFINLDYIRYLTLGADNHVNQIYGGVDAIV